MNTVPPWLKKRLVVNSAFFGTKKIISDLSLNTVCESAMCPNLNECFSKGKATFMILGRTCTRACAFCSVSKGNTGPVDATEPCRIAECAKRLGLKYVVVTSVTRDDLADGGAGQFARVAEPIKNISKEIVIELLIPDFKGSTEPVKTVVCSGADIIGHNIETASRLYPVARKGSSYRRSLDVLKLIKNVNTNQTTKSAILVGLGETDEEVIETMKDLRESGCDMLAIGQYLRPGKDNIEIKRFVTPAEFANYRETGLELGFKSVSAGPFVRSSYCAEENFKDLRRKYGKCYAAAVS